MGASESVRNRRGVDTQLLADKGDGTAVGVETSGGSQFQLRPTQVGAAGESSSGDMVDHRGATDPEVLGDVADEFTGEVRNKKPINLVRLESSLDLSSPRV